MLDIFVYLVSAILKVWHLVLRHIMDDSAAWLVSIALLVLTVRGLLVPLTWASLKSGRIALLMRPEAEKLDKRAKEATTVEDAKAAFKARSDLNKRYGYNAAAGCVPMLFMLPILIGLYQLLIRMARPEPASSIGLLNATEVQDFQNATWSGMPVQAFVAMPQSWAENMNVTPEEVRDFIWPWLLFTLVIVAANMLFTVWRSFYSTQFDKTFPRRIFYFLILMVFLSPLMLWWIAICGPLPVAIIYYWIWSNGFNFAQSIIMEVFLNRHYPLQEEHHEYRRNGQRRYRSGEAKAEAKAQKLARKQRTPEEREAERERHRAQAKARSELHNEKAERFSKWAEETAARRRARRAGKPWPPEQDSNDSPKAAPPEDSETGPASQPGPA